MADICQQCGSGYDKIALHWVQSTDCNYPSFSDHQREIITGLLMGDGTIHSTSKNPRLEAKMISQNYLEYIDNEFGIFGHGVSFHMSAEESAKEARETGFSLSANAENYSDTYVWYSMNHPELKEFENWYASGEKVWPADINLTPTVLKHWYSGDGHWSNTGSYNHIRISMSNEYGNSNKINKIFENANLPSPRNYTTYERTDGGMNFIAEFTVEQSKELWEYMGKPLPDFEYKWPEKYQKT